MEIKKVPGDFVGEYDISDGTLVFPGATSSPNNYDSEIQDISILPSREKQMGEPLTEEGKFEFRCELWN